METTIECFIIAVGIDSNTTSNINYIVKVIPMSDWSVSCLSFPLVPKSFSSPMLTYKTVTELSAFTVNHDGYVKFCVRAYMCVCVYICMCACICLYMDAIMFLFAC